MKAMTRTNKNPLATVFNVFDNDDFWTFPKPFPFTSGYIQTVTTANQAEKPLDKDESRIKLNISVFGKTQSERNQKLVQELRKIADSIELEVPQENVEEPVKESVVDFKIDRG